MATGSIKLGDLNNQISGGLWSSGSSILDWASERQQYKDSKKEEKANKQAAQFQVNSDSLLNSGLNSTDPKTSMMYMSGSSLEDLADAMDKFYFQTKRRHINRDKYPTANDIVNHWRETFPTSEVHINNLLNQTVDLPTTLERLGIALPSEETYTGTGSAETGNTIGNSNAGTNILQSVIDIPMNLGKMPFNLIDKGTAWLAKQFSDDDEAIDQQLEQNLQRTEDFATLPGANREDLSYQIPKMVEDLGVTVASSFIPGVGEAKWAERAAKFPEIAKLIKSVGSVEKLVKKYPGLAKFLKGGSIGVKDTALMNALEGEGTTPLEALEGRLAGGVFEKSMGGLKKLSAYLETNGLLKPTDAENIIKKLKTRGELNGKLRDITWIADVMTRNGLAGTKQQVYDEAIKKASQKRKLLLELIDVADKADAEKGITHSLREADEAVDLLKELLEKSDGSPMIPREDQLEFFKKMIAKRGVGDKTGLFGKLGNYSLSDLQRLKNEMDDLVGIYTDAGSVIEKQQSIRRDKERRAIKEYIEKEMKNRGFGDVEMMNNEISTLYEIANGVADKVISDSASKVSSVANTITDWAGPVAGIYLGYEAIQDLAEGDVSGALTKGAGVFLLNNTYFKTHLGSYLNRMSGVTRDEIQQWVSSNGRAELSKSAKEEIAKIIKEDESLKNSIKEYAKQYMAQFPKESAMVGGQKGLEKAVDNFME